MHVRVPVVARHHHRLGAGHFATVRGTCGTGTAVCYTGPGFSCSDRSGTSGTLGECSLDDWDAGADAVGGCSVTPPPVPPAACPHASPHAHTYGFGGATRARSQTVEGGRGVGHGVVTVQDTNSGDCDGDGVPGDFDGDWETGVGGAFFGYGPWANEPTCNWGLHTHGSTVRVNDVVFGDDVWFVVGADDTSGPQQMQDPLTGQSSCMTDGSITPGDPATDPLADPDDCFTAPQNLARGVGTGETCGAGGDGGYYVFLDALFLDEGSAGLLLGNPPTAGTITA